jgi:signal transduction histidine kinase
MGSASLANRPGQGRMTVQGVAGTGERREDAKAQVAVSSPSFTPLERQARRLQLLAACVVGFVAIIPALVFFFVALTDLRSDAERYARRLAPTVVALTSGSSVNLESLSHRVSEEMVANDLSSVRLLGENGREILVLGRGRGGFGVGEVRLQLAASDGPVREIRVEPGDRGLHRRAAWVLGIHLAVATLLAVVVYRVPMRALWGAIDEVRRSQAQLLHSERLSAIGGMYAALTHEINNPLGIILTRVRLMLDSAEERGFSPELVHDLQVVDHHSSRIAEIAGSLLAFARKTDLTLAATDVNAIIGELVALVELPFAKQGIRIQTLLDSPLPRIRASADHLQQAFLNMLYNARDAMPEGGIITLRTFVNGSNLVTEIRDTGNGMSPEVRARVFEPFFTTKDVGKGTGLGLSVSHGIVRAHEGDITIDSSPGKGATFRVTLPI